jgi:hypothetical protein
VFANLFAYHLCQRFPNVKPALLIRKPFEVALSKHKKSNWNWTTDPRDFLKQPQLVEDYLQPFAELIERIGAGDDPIAKHIAGVVHHQLCAAKAVSQRRTARALL